MRAKKSTTSHLWRSDNMKSAKKIKEDVLAAGLDTPVQSVVSNHWLIFHAGKFIFYIRKHGEKRGAYIVDATHKDANKFKARNFASGHGYKVAT